MKPALTIAAILARLQISPKAMKAMFSRRVVVAVLLCGTPTASAMPSTLRKAEGRIVAVEPAAHRLTFQRNDNHKSFVLTWDHRTTFHHSATGAATIPRAGQRAWVSYRLPLFGPDYVSRVLLVTPATSSK